MNYRFTCYFQIILILKNSRKASMNKWIPRRYFFCGSFVLFMSCVCHAFATVHCCLVVTCWERADLLFVMFNCAFVPFPCGTLGQVWHLIVLIAGLCRLSYFKFRLGQIRLLFCWTLFCLNHLQRLLTE